ncbi:unnamed protein product, partial [Aphanomyces euteiches]
MAGGKANSKARGMSFAIQNNSKPWGDGATTSDGLGHNTTVGVSSAVNMYTPVVGRVPTKIDLERAINEFHRLENQQVDEMDVKVHFAKDVNLFQWRKSPLSDRFRYLRFTAVVQAGVTADTVNARTTCDIFIVQLVGTPHEGAVVEITGQIGQYDFNECNRACQVRGGRIQFTISGNGNIADREPDTAFTPPGTNIPTIIFEFSHHHESFVAVDQWCREYFFTPGVRQVIAFKMLETDARLLACVVVQYGRDANGGVEIVDAVSFGERPVDPQRLPAIQNDLRQLPSRTRDQFLDNQNPWNAIDNPFLTIPRAEMIFNTNPALVAPVGPDL